MWKITCALLSPKLVSSSLGITPDIQTTPNLIRENEKSPIAVSTKVLRRGGQSRQGHRRPILVGRKVACHISMRWAHDCDGPRMWSAFSCLWAPGFVFESFRLLGTAFAYILCFRPHFDSTIVQAFCVTHAVRPSLLVLNSRKICHSADSLHRRRYWNPDSRILFS